LTETGDLTRTSQLLLASRVARMHYVEDLSNLEIAARLGISRFRVARLLERALKSGIVEITIHSPLEVDQELSAALISRFGLSDALVYPVTDGANGSESIQLVRAGVGRLAARYLADILPEGGTLGVTWGDALEAVSRALATIDEIPKCDVVQLVGGISSSASSSDAMDVLARFTSACRGRLSALDAPLVVSDPRTAEGLRGEASIKHALAKVRDLDAAIVGIGSWEPPLSSLIPLFSPAEIEEARTLDAAADISAIIIDKHGHELQGTFGTLTIRATSEDFRRIPHVIGVAYGQAKSEAVRAVLAGGWSNVLVTDSHLARRLLESGEK